MLTPSKIEWTDAVWNPVTGCNKVSQGCKNCYAEREWQRLSANPKTDYYGRVFTDVKTHPDRLWRASGVMCNTKPKRVFVNSMSDLFHESVPFSFIDDVFEVINCAPQNTFQILTKRPERMLAYMTRQNAWMAGLDNVWLGVSVEDQETADLRIPLLLQTPAAVRWISAESLLSEIDLMVDSYYLKPHCPVCLSTEPKYSTYEDHLFCEGCDTSYPIDHFNKQRLHWIVVGGESGPNARPMHPDWVRSLRKQCMEADVAFHFKQWGEWTIDLPAEGDDLGRNMRRGIVQHVCVDRQSDGHFMHGDVHMRRVGKKAAGRLLDGVLHDQYPG